MSKTQQQKKDLIFEGLIMKRVIRLDDISNHVYGYDHNGNIIYHEVRDKKLKTWSEYNDDGKLIRHKDSKNNIEVYFDGNGNEISEEEFILLYSR